MKFPRTTRRCYRDQLYGASTPGTLGDVSCQKNNGTFSGSVHITIRYRCLRISIIGLNWHAWIGSRTPALCGKVRCSTNIFDSRNEGTATGVEEMFMHAGLYEDSPRSRELVWILVAQRAARGLGSLYAHANEMTMEQAGGIHMDWTPRGWMKTERELLIFEQHLYMRQPGYGTSYITGKYLLERTLADYAKQCEERGKEFKLKDFFDRLNAIDSIPITLGRWEMTGLDDEIRRLTESEQIDENAPSGCLRRLTRLSRRTK